MFLKITKAKNFEYIKLVESYRENGTTKHRLLYNFGRADQIKKDESFLNVVKKLCEITGIAITKNPETNKNSVFDNCSEATFYNYGYFAYLKLWNELDIGNILYGFQSGSSKIQFPIPETAFLMAVQHLLEPRSKLSTYAHQNRYFNLDNIALQHMYRTLDKLSVWKEEIESELFEYNYVRTGQSVDVVFYDVTTFAFESVAADELKDFGYSKDCKFNEVQVVMGMIIDINGMPIGYELFQGNTFDGKTMLEALNNIKKRFGVNRVIIVADRGINNKDNLKLIKKAGYGYIMSSKIKGMSNAIKKKILDTEGFTVVNDESGNEDYRYKIMPYINIFTDKNKEQHRLEENLVITYSPKRAKKDQKDRERLVEKAKKLLENPEKIKASNKRGGKKYIDQTDPKETQVFSLATEKIEQDARFDGYYGIQSSEKNMTATKITEAYHMLWKIEESFRIMKSTMEVRPIFHWTPKRIRGHFVICFLAFLMERKLEYLLKGVKDEISASPDKIQESLNSMQIAAIETESQGEVFIKAKPDPLSEKIFRLLKMQMPSNISKKTDIIACFQLGDGLDSKQMSFF
jgi:transposase